MVTTDKSCLLMKELQEWKFKILSIKLIQPHQLCLKAPEHLSSQEFRCIFISVCSSFSMFIS